MSKQYKFLINIGFNSYQFGKGLFPSQTTKSVSEKNCKMSLPEEAGMSRLYANYAYARDKQKNFEPRLLICPSMATY